MVYNHFLPIRSHIKCVICTFWFTNLHFDVFNPVWPMMLWTQRKVVVTNEDPNELVNE